MSGNSSNPSSGDSDRVGGLDSVDAARLRLMALRTRIDTNWPQSGGILRRRPARPEKGDTVGRLLAALPTPLPVSFPGLAEPIMRESDTDLRVAAGRAVDAAMMLLDGDSLDATYPGTVTMFAGIGPLDDEGCEADPVEVVDPTVGLLVATIIGTLEAVSERLIPFGGTRDVRRS